VKQTRRRDTFAQKGYMSNNKTSGRVDINEKKKKAAKTGKKKSRVLGSRMQSHQEKGEIKRNPLIQTAAIGGGEGVSRSSQHLGVVLLEVKTTYPGSF